MGMRRRMRRMTIYDKKPLPDGVSAAGRGLQPRPAIRRSHKKMKPDTETEIRIADIRNCPEVIPVLAQWFEDEFGYEDVTKEDETSWLEQSLQTDEGLPTTLVAYAGGILVGTARIFTDEMDDRPQYNPWFGYWFVLPSHRKQGIGTALDQARLKAAKKEKIGRVYLCTHTQKAYRFKRDWRLIEERIYYGHDAAVFYKDL